MGDTYHALEDKYYALLDKIDAVIPIYKIVEPIDKVFPSFVLLLAVIVLLIVGGLFFYFQPLEGQYKAIVIVKDNEGLKLSGIDLAVVFENGDTNELITDSEGKAEFFAERNAKITIVMEIAGFEKFEKEFKVDENGKIITITLSPIEEAAKKKTIHFKDAQSNRLISGKSIVLELSCSNSDVIPDPKTVTDSDKDGIVEVIQPKDCGTLIVKATIPGYEQKDFPLNDDFNPIEMSAPLPEEEYGTLKVVVKNEQGERIENIKVSVLEEGRTINSGRTVGGEASFSELLPGTYEVEARDTATEPEYATETVQDIEIEANKQAIQQIILSKAIKGNFKITVKDKSNGSRIANASIRLEKAGGESYATASTNAEGETAVIAVKDDLTFKLIVFAEAYLPFEGSASLANSEITIELEKATEQNSGKVTVYVLDEDGKKTENAKVYLRYAENDSIAPYPEKISDANGTAEWMGVIEGKYYATAEKFLSRGDSEKKDVKLIGENVFTAVIKFGKATLKLSTVDKDGIAIPFARAEIRSAGGIETALQIPFDSLGKAEIQVKADKAVYVIARHDNYAKVQTKTYQLYGGKKIEIEIKMPEKFFGENPKIEMEGFYFEGKKTEVLEAGKNFEAKLRLFIPEGTNFSSAGIHFRTGEDRFLENDVIKIKSANVAEAAVVRGTTFNPPTGENIDFDSGNLSEGDAKWVNLNWNESIEAGVYEASVIVRVSDSARLGEKLGVHYRAWAKKENSAVQRSPLDSELGTSTGTAAKQALYAKTFDPELYEGDVPECNERQVCISALKLKDLSTSPYLIYNREPFALLESGTYEVSFNLVNESSVRYENALFYASATDATLSPINSIEFLSYSITNANEQKFSSEQITENRIEGIGLGSFTTSKSAKAVIKFRAKSRGAAYIYAKVVDAIAGSIVFEKKIALNVNAGNALNIEAKPELIPALKPTDINVFVFDSSNEPVEKVLLTVRKDDGVIRQIIAQGETSRKGMYKFTVPSSMPGTKLLFRAEKLGYRSGELEVLIDANVLDLSPKNIATNLSLSGIDRETRAIYAKNLIGSNLRISGLDFSNRSGFGQLLDLGYSDNYFSAFTSPERPTIIPAFSEDFEANLYSVKLRTGAGNGSKKGFFIIRTKDESVGAEWSQTIPLTVNVGIGGELEEWDCLLLEGDSIWNAVVQDSATSFEFRIVNGCKDKTSKRGVALKEISAKAEWNGEQLGELTLQLSSSSTGGSGFAELSREEKGIYGTAAAGEEFSGVLTLNPDAAKKQLSSSFDLIITAAVQTDSGEKTVYLSPAKITGNIGAIDLLQCVELTPSIEEGLVLEPSEEEKTFKISTKKCGNIEVEFRFCYGDSGCKGGTQEGGIDVTTPSGGNITTNPIRIPASDSTKERSIKVRREAIAGIYGITIEAQTPGRAWRLLRTYDVLVKPDSGYNYYLSKYDFAIPKKGTKDSTTLYNTTYDEQINVKASVCDWKEAEKKFWSWGKFAQGTKYGGMSWTFIVAKTALAWSNPWGWAIIVIPGLFGGLFGEDPCAKTDTRTLPAFITNLTKDKTEEIKIEPWSGKIGAKWKADEINYLTEYGHTIQTMGITFENLGIQEEKPVYGVMGIGAEETSYGGAHYSNPTIICESNPYIEKYIGGWGPYNLANSNCYYGGAENKTHPHAEMNYEKFHLRFKTNRYDEGIPPISTNRLSCVREGGVIGRQGEGAVPRIKLDWKWQGNIDWQSCDAGNENYVYCDATQFSIMLSERMHKLEEFLKENGYYFSCPLNPAIVAAGQLNAQAVHEVPSGKIGIKEVKYEKKENIATLTATVFNNSGTAKNGSIFVELNVPSDVNYANNTCTQEFLGIEAGATQNVSCSFSDLPESKESYYIATISVNSSPSEETDSWQFTITFLGEAAEQGTCWLPPSTLLISEKPTLTYYLDKTDEGFGQYVTEENISYNGNIVQTDSTNTAQIVKELNDLMHFNAYLIKDSYSADFQTDFADYYEKIAFMNAPSWFTDQNPSTNASELSSYFKDLGRLKFKRKYIESNELNDAGLYRVDVEIQFSGGDWKLFDAEGKPKALITVVFDRLRSPSPNSPFYYLPFDGTIGEENGVLKRKGYGAGFDLISEKAIRLNDTAQQNTLLPKAGEAAPFVEGEANIISGLKQLNSDLDTRGNILYITQNPEGSFALNFSPSRATPVALKMTQALTDRPFSAIFGLKESGVPALAGDNLTYWSGIGACLDFEGEYVFKAFNYRKDTKAVSEDPIQNFASYYKIQWNKAVRGGNVWLKTVLYSPTEKSLSFDAEYPIARLKLFSADAANSSSISLNGISSMQYNNTGKGSKDRIDSLQDVLEMVKSGEACIIDNGMSATIYWNEEALFAQKGQQKSINELEQALSAGANCIGYGS